MMITRPRNGLNCWLILSSTLISTHRYHYLQSQKHGNHHRSGGICHCALPWAKRSLHLPMPFMPRGKYWISLIPPGRAHSIPLAPWFVKHSQNSGIKGRPFFPKYSETVAHIDKYLLSQTLGPKQVPNLKFPLHMPGQFQGIILPEDVIQRDTARQQSWQQLINRRSWDKQKRKPKKKWTHSDALHSL